MAQSGGPRISASAPLSGVKQTFGERVENDANDPTATSAVPIECVSVAAVFDGPLSKNFDGLPASASRAL